MTAPLSSIKQWLCAARDVALPRLCPVCRCALNAQEPALCRSCLDQLPRTHYEQQPFNEMEQRVAGIVPVERAAAYFFYDKGAPYAGILHDIKYRNRPHLAYWLAARAAQQMAASGLFDGVQALVPVPLHRAKLVSRGYNQSAHIVQGLASVTGIACCSVLKVKHSHSTQTHKNKSQRWQDLQDTFVATADAQRVNGCHVMLVDDVITTGATLVACAQALLAAVPNVKISLFTLAATSQLQ